MASSRCIPCEELAGLGPADNPVEWLVVTAPSEAVARTRARRFGHIIQIVPHGKKWKVAVSRKAQNPELWMQQAIKRPGKLGGKGFLTKPLATQKNILDRCERQYGYRSCLGSIMFLQRVPDTKARFGRRLGQLQGYLKRSFGGPGSFGPRRVPRIPTKKRPRFPNPNEPGHFLLIPELSDHEPIMVKTNPAFEKEMSLAAATPEEMRAGFEAMKGKPGKPHPIRKTLERAAKKKAKKKGRSNPGGLGTVMRSALRGT